MGTVFGKGGDRVLASIKCSRLLTSDDGREYRSLRGRGASCHLVPAGNLLFVSGKLICLWSGYNSLKFEEIWAFFVKGSVCCSPECLPTSTVEKGAAGLTW